MLISNQQFVDCKDKLLIFKHSMILLVLENLIIGVEDVIEEDREDIEDIFDGLKLNETFFVLFHFK